MYYQILNRVDLGDYGSVDIELIEDVAYTPDAETAIIKISEKIPESDKIIKCTETAFTALQTEHANYIKSINIIDAKI